MSRPERAGDAVIVFDGVCVLCSAWVAFLLKRDGRRQFRFAAMQGDAGAALLRAHGLDPSDPMSFLLVDAQGAKTDSDAVLAVLARLGGMWTSAALLRAIPRAWRDAGYRWLARNRYRWFGKHAACSVPDPSQRDRFLT